MKTIFAAILMAAILSPVSASAWTCSQVRWAMRTFSKETIAAYAKAATAEEKEKAKRCLGRRHVR